MKSLIICSGGLDSVSMALIEQSYGNTIGLIVFDYGQKAFNEINVVKTLAKKYNLKYKIIDISSISEIFGKNQLTDDNINIENKYQDSVVVPLRNSLFIQIAYIYAMTNNYDRLVLGSHLDDIKLDKNGDIMFPDGTPMFFKEMNKALRLGCRKDDKKVEIISASILGFDKGYLINKGIKLDSDMIFKTWSCYKNGEYQCGVCDSCKNRKKSFKQAKIKDLTKYDIS